MTAFEGYTLIILAVAAIVVPLLAWAFRRGVFARFLTNRELVILGKILFIVFVMMLYIVVQNARGIPAGQFIYGRF